MNFSHKNIQKAPIFCLNTVTFVDERVKIFTNSLGECSHFF